MNECCGVTRKVVQDPAACCDQKSDEREAQCGCAVRFVCRSMDLQILLKFDCGINRSRSVNRFATVVSPVLGDALCGNREESTRIPL